MPTSTSDLQSVRAVDVRVTEDELSVGLEDGRTLVIPLAWYPRLVHGSKRERTRWHLIGRGSAFIGPRWTRTSALRASWLGDGLVRARNRSSAGCRCGCQPGLTSACSRRRAGRAAADTQVVIRLCGGVDLARARGGRRGSPARAAGGAPYDRMARGQEACGKAALRGSAGTRCPGPS